MRFVAYLRWAVCTTLGILALAGQPVRSGVSVAIDTATLNDLLSVVATREVVVPIAEGQSLTVQLEDLRITGLEPGACENAQGFIRAAVRLRAPEFGLLVPVEPRLSLTALELDGRTVVELRFERVDLQVPLVGSFNVARMLPPIRFPADNVFQMAGPKGPIEVASLLRNIHMERDAIHFEFAIEIPE